MSPSTRNLLIASASIVAVGICVGLVAHYAGVLPRDETRPELAFIPPDVSVVAFADVRSIMDSQVRQKLRQAMPTGTEKNRLLEETGIDLERDIDSVMAGVSNRPGEGGTVVVLRGRFDQERMGALASAKGATREEYRGVSMLVGLAPSPEGSAWAESGARVAALAFLDGNLLALGDVSAVRAAIDTSAVDQGVETNPDLMRAIKGVEGTGNAWLVGRAAYLLDQHPHVSGQVREHLEEIEWLTVSAHVDQGVRGVVGADTRDPQAGQQLRSVVAGLLMAARAFGGQESAAAEAFNALQVTGSGARAELAFDFSGDLLDKLASSAASPLWHEPPR